MGGLMVNSPGNGIHEPCSHSGRDSLCLLCTNAFVKVMNAQAMGKITVYWAL